MTGPAPDLAALRSMCRIRLCGRGESRVEAYAAAGNWLANRPDQILAVLALVDTLQADNERLREALVRFGHHHEWCAYRHDGTVCGCGLHAALSVSPAEKEQPRDWRKPCICGHAVYQHPGNACMGTGCVCQEYREAR